MVPQLHAISWNITRRCNLRCAHCYLDADFLEGRRVDEKSTEDCFRIVDQIRDANPNPFLILTGGEPLLRPDVFDIAAYASDRGAYVVVGTNGIALTEKSIGRLKRAGVKGAGVSLDSTDSRVHDAFRGVMGAWDLTMSGIRRLAAGGMPFAVQMTVTETNAGEIETMADLAHSAGATALNVYFLVCTGRGQEMTDLSPEAYERILTRLYDLYERYEGRMLVTAKCAPHFRRFVYERNPSSPLMKTYQGGCPAGTHYARITPSGDVTPCPYMADPVGNLKEFSFVDLWRNAPAFVRLRDPILRDRCGICEFRTVCGGCRARALSKTGDMLGTDPWCTYAPGKRKMEEVVLSRETALGQPVAFSISWTPEARERLERIPSFARGMVVASVERYAAERAVPVVTPELMAEAKERLIGDGRGVPAFLKAGRPS